jgi:hypothetical protein
MPYPVIGSTEDYDPPGSYYEPEHRYRFTAPDPAGSHVVIQGSIMANIGWPPSDDEFVTEYHVHLLVGPYWKHVEAVVPSVTIALFRNPNADEDDQQYWEILDVDWQLLSGTGAHVGEFRIRLNFKVRVGGENSNVGRISYFVFARGRELGDGGLNEPGPVRSTNPSS